MTLTQTERTSRRRPAHRAGQNQPDHRHRCVEGR
jgi:hypothetical protein